jgi:hypothetical protein
MKDVMASREVINFIMFGYILSKVRAMLMYPVKDLPWPA